MAGIINSYLKSGDGVRLEPRVNGNDSYYYGGGSLFIFGSKRYTVCGILKDKDRYMGNKLVVFGREESYDELFNRGKANV